jgi:hypothetical protein
MDSKLNNIKDSGFKIPKNYLEDFEDSFLSEIKLKNIGSSGFKLPEGYLESIDEKILDKVSRNSEPKVINLFTRRHLLYVSSIAATILLLFNLSIFERKKISFDTLETASVESYIMNADIDSYKLGELLNTDEINEENFIEHNFSEENMEAYILNNVDVLNYYSE